MTATDVSEDALAVARANAAAHDVASRVPRGQPARAGRRVEFDLVIANLPYVGADEAVDPEVSGFEPAVAVFAPDGGRALVERLIRDVPIVLAPGGRVALELGDGQAPWLGERLAALGYAEAGITRDLRGVERVVSAAMPLTR